MKNYIRTALGIACLVLPPLGLAPQARAQWGQGDEAPDSAVVTFIKRHPQEVGAGAVVCLFVFFALIMGPADLLDAMLRRRRAQGRERAIDRLINGRGKDGE